MLSWWTGQNSTASPLMTHPPRPDTHYPFPPGLTPVNLPGLTGSSQGIAGSSPGLWPTGIPIPDSRLKPRQSVIAARHTLLIGIPWNYSTTPEFVV